MGEDLLHRICRKSIMHNPTPIMHKTGVFILYNPLKRELYLPPFFRVPPPFLHIPIRIMHNQSQIIFRARLCIIKKWIIHNPNKDYV